MGWVGTVLLVIGTLLTGQRRRVGFVWCFVGEALWVIHANALEQLDLFVVCLIFTAVYAFNWWSWRTRSGLRIYK